MEFKPFEIVVAGGGIVGASAAYYLARAGRRVALLEKGAVGGGQSGRNWGSVRAQGRSRAELPLMLEAGKIWPQLESELAADLHWRQRGQMLVAHARAQMESFEAFLPLAREFGLDTRILPAAAISETQPGFRPGPGCLGAMFTPSDGCAEPALVAPAFARAAARLGATVMENCAALSLESEGGKIRAVESERGRLRTEVAVAAAGAGTAGLVSPLGLFHPSLLIRGTAAHVRFRGDPPPLREMVAWGRSAIRRRPDGTLTLAASEDGVHFLGADSVRLGWRYLPLAWRNRRNLRLALRGDSRASEPPPDLAGIAAALAAFHREYPGAGETEVVRAWAGDIDYTPDALPIIDAPAAVGGLFVAAGFSGDGFGLGPAAGREVARWICKGRPGTDLSPFRASRFRRPLGFA